MHETWVRVEIAPEYLVSDQGRVSKNGQILKSGHVTDGSRSVVLRDAKGHRPHLIRKLVAAAFCEPLTAQCDTVVHLDGDKENCNASNLVWRPRWYAWQYTHQFNESVRSRWMYPIVNISTGEEFGSIIEAGMRYGMLWQAIYVSCIEHRITFPYGYEFRFV